MGNPCLRLMGDDKTDNGLRRLKKHQAVENTKLISSFPNLFLLTTGEKIKKYIANRKK